MYVDGVMAFRLRDPDALPEKLALYFDYIVKHETKAGGLDWLPAILKGVIKCSRLPTIPKSSRLIFWI